MDILSAFDSAPEQKQQNFKRSAWVALIATLILLPIVFVPSSLFPFGLTKVFVLTAGVLIATALWLLGTLAEGEIQVPKHPVFIALFALPIVYLLSALFSGSFLHSFLGNGFEIDTVLSILLLALITFLASVLFQGKERARTFLSGLFIAFILVALFQILRLIVGGDAVTLGTFFSNVDNMVGKWNDLGMLSGLFVVLSLITLELPLKKIQRGVLYVALLLALFIMIVVNFTLAWVIVGIFALLFFIYTLSFGLVYSKRKNERGSYIPVRPLVVFLFALVFVIAGGPLGNTISSAFDISQIEARPSWGATFEMAEESFKENPLFGAGPNNFRSQWVMHKPDGINETIFWNTDFNVGIGSIPTSIVTTGAVGVIAWFALLLLFLLVGFRYIGRSNTDDPTTAFLEISSFFAAIYGWIFLIAYVPNIVVAALTFAFMGIFLAVQREKGTLPTLSISGFSSPRQAFGVTFVAITLLIGVVAWGYIATTRYVAAVYFQKGVQLANTSTDIDSVESHITQAARLHNSDQYHRTLAELTLLRLNQVLSQENVPEETLRTQFQNTLSNAVGFARNATNINPDNYQNWMTLGRVYATITPLEIEGAYESAVAAYDRARELNPHNPEIELTRARLEISSGNMDEARNFIQAALEKKNNYTEAVFLLSQLEAQSGNIEQAISAARSATILAPNDPTVFFQLGLLYYTEEQFADAVPTLERAVILLPTYSNAKYFLGLSYFQEDRVDDAIAQFEDLVTLNPDNQEVQDILENLQAGETPFAGATPPADTPPEERDTLPVEEEEVPVVEEE
ncbi:MAG: tetratricopeptide repeat protein [Candidatus Paceibacterota bacterium]